MCQNIYISSAKELPEITWDEQKPTFYLSKVIDQGIIEMLKPIFNTAFVYEAFSHLGCSCGLCYGEWSSEAVNEDHEQRKEDVKAFMNYLDTYKKGNSLKIFTTMWEEFWDKYEEKEFATSELNEVEFDLDEMIILNVI